MAIAQTRTKASAAPPTPPPPQRISMSVGSFTQGGLIDDIDVEITDAITCEYDYNGAAPLGPALAVEFTDHNGTASIQYYSAGKAEDFSPDDAGEGFLSVSGKTGVNNSTNLGKFLASMVEAGFPDDMLAEGNLKVIVGTKCHVNQVVQERKGLIRTGKNADRPSTALLVSKIHSLPGAKATAGVGVKAKAGVAARPVTAAATTAKAGKANGAATTAVVTPQDLDFHIFQGLKSALEGGGEIPGKSIAKTVYDYFNANDMAALANKAVTRAGTQALRAAFGDNGFVYENAVLTLAAEE